MSEESPTELVTTAQRKSLLSLSDADRLMLRYVDKLTRTPAHITRDDVDALRKAGFSDAAILDICQVAAYYAFVNRIADGLGVELE